MKFICSSNLIQTDVVYELAVLVEFNLLLYEKMCIKNSKYFDKRIYNMCNSSTNFKNHFYENL